MFGESGWMGAGMWIFWILLIVVIVVLVKAVSSSGASTPADHQDSPLEILKGRYARGEIVEEEFERRRRELEK